MLEKCVHFHSDHESLASERNGIYFFLFAGLFVLQYLIIKCHDRLKVFFCFCFLNLKSDLVFLWSIFRYSKCFKNSVLVTLYRLAGSKKSNLVLFAKN